MTFYIVAALGVIYAASLCCVGTLLIRVLWRERSEPLARLSTVASARGSAQSSRSIERSAGTDSHPATRTA
ncbi:hypothetical protein [Flexivirga sp. B27]